jgi:putative ABC transport system permease protein
MKTETRLPFYLMLQYLRRGRKWTLALTLFMMSVAFVNLIFISSLFAGIIDGTNKQIIDTMTGNIYVTPKSGSDYIVSKQAVKDIRAIDGVAGVSAQFQLPARLKYKNITGNWQILAINPSDEETVTNIADKIMDGKYLDANDTDHILIGRQIAGGEGVEGDAFSFKGAKVGDKVTMEFDGGFNKEFTIGGIFYTKFIQSDQRAFITNKALQQIYPSMSDNATTIIVKVGSGAKEENIISDIKAKGISESVYTWRDVAGLMKSVSESFTSINVLMSLVGVLIAAVTIFIVVYVDIINKRRQIGILRAIGIKSYIIVFSYVILAAVYSVIGVILGTAIFYLILVPYFNAHPFVLPICDAVLKLSAADYIARAEAVMWVSVASGLIPSLLVVRTKMLDAILGK